MMQYSYHARNGSGAAITGQMTAPSVQAVAEHLRGRSLVAVDIRRKSRVGQALAPLRQASNGAALIVSLRTLATLLEVGLPMRKALEIVLHASRNLTLREGFSAVLASVESGEALGSAMQRREDLFSPMTIALVQAGERGGVLFETLERHAQNLEQQQTFRRRLLTTMIYPVVVLLTALGLVAFLMVSVLPMFAALFEQLHVEQPLLLRTLLGIPAVCNVQSIAFFLAGLAAVGYLLNSRRSHMRVPIVSALQEKASTARFARALATLLKAGVSLPEALAYVRPVLSLQRFRLATNRINEALRDGNSLASAIHEQGVFDPLLVHLIRVGEETGTLDVQLLRLAEWFERDFSEALARAAALIEPLLIVGIGMLVGTIVFSVFVPLYSLIGGIR